MSGHIFRRGGPVTLPKSKTFEYSLGSALSRQVPGGAMPPPLHNENAPQEIFLRSCLYYTGDCHGPSALAMTSFFVLWHKQNVTAQISAGFWTPREGCPYIQNRTAGDFPAVLFVWGYGLHHRHSLRSPRQCAHWLAMTAVIDSLFYLK